MKTLDRFLQRWRIRKVLPYVPQGARVLDIGCYDGALFRAVGVGLGEGIGIDPEAPWEGRSGSFTIVRGVFPQDVLECGTFDVVTMLAVLEHIPEQAKEALLHSVAACLKPNGCFIITVPSPFVDRILSVLSRLRLIDGMSLDEHHGFHPEQVPILCGSGPLRVVRHQSFQLGLNNLFILKKAAVDELAAAEPLGQ